MIFSIPVYCIHMIESLDTTGDEVEKQGVVAGITDIPDHDVVSEITADPNTQEQHMTVSRFVIGAGIISGPGIQ